MLFLLLAILLFPIHAISQATEIDSVANYSLIDLVDRDWSEWSECSNSCGGCGMQNRTLILPSGMRIVHARHCNLKPCVDGKKLCCEPFKFLDDKCLLEENIQDNQGKFNESQEQIKEAVNITIEFPNDKKFGNESSEEISKILNVTGEINSYPNTTGNVDDNLFDGSGEFDEEMNSKTNNTDIHNAGIKSADASYTSKNKIESGTKGYNRKDYKQQQRRTRQHLSRAGSKSRNLVKSENSQKMFDAAYEYDYYDVYYYYY